MAPTHPPRLDFCVTKRSRCQEALPDNGLPLYPGIPAVYILGDCVFYCLCGSGMMLEESQAISAQTNDLEWVLVHLTFLVEPGDPAQFHVVGLFAGRGSGR